jgi:hypothetical protein
MGLFKSQKKMVACPYCPFPAYNRNNADSGGRVGSGAFYLYIILIFPKRSKRDYAKSGKIIGTKKDNKLLDQYTVISRFSLRCRYYYRNNSAAAENSQY